MAWTDYSSTESNNWATTAGGEVSSTGLQVLLGVRPTDGAVFYTTAVASPNELINSYNVPGFDDGYSPVTPDPIANNMNQGGGGGGPTRPTSGFLYPRGQG